MHIIDCKTIQKQTLKGVTQEHFVGKSLLLLLKEDNPANRSYIMAIKAMAKPYALTMEVRRPNPAHPMDDIRCFLKSRHDGTGVLFVGYERNEVVGIHRECHKEMMGKWVADNGKYPDVVYAVLEVLGSMNTLANPPARTAIIGRSRNARSLCTALLLMGHTPTIVHTETVDMDSVLRDSGLIISFAGCPNLIKSHMVKDGATVISVGCGTVDGKLCGDIDMESLAGRDVSVTPTPSGIGPVCTAVMLRDLAAWEPKEERRCTRNW